MKKSVGVVVSAVILSLFGFGLGGMVRAAERVVELLPNGPATQFFSVAPDGSDSADGTEMAPFASLARGVAAVKKFQAEHPNTSVAIHVRSGDYPLSTPLELDNIHGTLEHPVVIRRSPGAESNPVFSGGTDVVGWEPLEGSAFWASAEADRKKRIRSEAIPSIWIAPYEGELLTDLYDPSVYGARQEFFAGGVPQTLARWPNNDFAVAGNPCGATPISSWGPKGTAEGIFEFATDQPDGWNDEPDAWLFGYWFWDWAESFARLEKIDRNAGTLEVKKPYHGYGYKSELRYYGFNLLCELDASGEYFIDRDCKKIFWIPPSGTNPRTVETRLPSFSYPFMVEINNSSHVVLAGLTFTEGFGGAVRVQNSDSILLADADFSRFGNDAISITGGTGCGLYHCMLETLGCGGMTLSGGDRATLTNANHFVSQTTVRDFSRIKRTYAPAILATGCGMTFEHCDFSESSSSAIRLEGNEFLVEYSRFARLVEESDDQGGIDVFYNPTYRGNVIRFNHWQDIVGGTHCGAAAIRFDDMISGYTVFGNIFVRCGAKLFGAVQIHGGKENVVENNLFLDSLAAVSFSLWGDRYVKAFTDPESPHYPDMRNKLYEEVNINSDVWRNRYPELVHIAESPDVNRVQNNLLINCESAFLRAGGMLQVTNNTELKIEGVTEATVTAPEFLAQHGLTPIPTEKIGPQNVSWLDD